MAEFFEGLLRYSHIVAGFAGLTAFWVPVFSKKGGPRHVRFGTVFLWCAYIVLASAGASVILHLLEMAVAGQGPRDRPNDFGFLVFLGYLALVTYINVRHAIGVLRSKARPADWVTPGNRAAAWLSIAVSAGLVSYALYYRPPVMVILLALSPIGFGVGAGILRYLNGGHAQPRGWFYEHLGGMLGAGIAFHTAFAVFGSSQLFGFRFEGWVAIVPWILPALIGIPASVLWTRHYQRKFAVPARQVPA